MILLAGGCMVPGGAWSGEGGGFWGGAWLGGCMVPGGCMVRGVPGGDPPFFFSNFFQIFFSIFFSQFFFSKFFQNYFSIFDQLFYHLFHATITTTPLPPLVNERAVRILLECILVYDLFLHFSKIVFNVAF